VAATFGLGVELPAKLLGGQPKNGLLAAKLRFLHAKDGQTAWPMIGKRADAVRKSAYQNPQRGTIGSLSQTWRGAMTRVGVSDVCRTEARTNTRESLNHRLTQDNLE
jgi:hypothetical protein